MEKTSASVPAKRKGYSPMQWVHMVITLALMFLFGYLPPFATVTPLGMKLLGVFIGVIYGYSACGDIIWPVCDYCLRHQRLLQHGAGHHQRSRP